MGPCGAINQKMVLTNVVQDAILYLKMNCQHMLQKFPYPIVVQFMTKVELMGSDSNCQSNALTPPLANRLHKR